GVYLLTFTDAATLKIALGIFLVAFGSYALLAPALPKFTAGGRAADGTIGFIGGILGGIGGYSGVLPTIWTQLRGWSKEAARAVYQPYVIVIQAITVAGILLVAADRTSLVLFAAILPAVLAGTWIGWQLFGRLNDRRFRQALAVLLIASGATLVL
ncbi:MAG TPA: TSUP family transporter, partial [Xanthobacteraceae bacterium]|nr:TSUP family transporter [Xanthobacteraceae bacterium]